MKIVAPGDPIIGGMRSTSPTYSILRTKAQRSKDLETADRHNRRTIPVLGSDPTVKKGIRASRPDGTSKAAIKKTFIVGATIQESLFPDERDAKYGDPLDKALKNAKLGSVIDGGTALSKRGRIAWIDLDVELVSLTHALAFAKLKLRELGVPIGSTLEVARDGKSCSIPIHDG